MGVSLSWVAVKGLPLEEILSRLGLARTGQTCGYPVDDIACHPLQGGAWLVMANRCGHRIAAPDSMAVLSAGCEAVCCDVEEHVDFAACACWQDGRQRWLVTHAGEEDPEDMSWEGKPPARFHALLADVASDDSTDPDAWFHTDIPLILGREFGGFRHDDSDPAFDALPFEALADLRRKQPWWRKLWR